MRVYRCISAREITNLYKGNNERKAIVEGQNTHHYVKGEEYIHFFRYSQSAEYYYNQRRFCSLVNSLDSYIAYMTANIPNEILNKYFGYGLYSDVDKSLASIYVPLPEYAIPRELFRDDYIVEINKSIESDYSSNETEYSKYLSLIRKLARKYNYSEEKITEYLLQNDLSHLLDVVDDNRSESEIIDGKVKQLLKVWDGWD